MSFFSARILRLPCPERDSKSMQELVNEYFESDNCMKCQEKKPAKKEMEFLHGQEIILIIQMKRFSATNTKLSSEITGKLYFVAQNVVVKILTLKHLYSHPVFCF